MFEKGADYLVFIKRDSDENWLTVACVISNEINISSKTIEVSSGCSPGWEDHLNSVKSFTINADGLAISDELELSQASYDILFALSVSGEPFAIKIAKIGSLYVREGIVTIVEYSENQSVNELFGFSVTFKGKGKINGGFYKYLANDLGHFIVVNGESKVVVDIRE